MFQLIVAVISIALVAILAIASIYYGGSAFQRSGMKAQVDALVNAGQQISGAQSLYLTDYGVPASDVPSLEATGANGTYLSAAPAIPAVSNGQAWSLVGASSTSNGFAVLPFTVTDTTQVCAAVATQGGDSKTPQFYCSDTSGVAATDVTKAGAFAFKL